MNNGMDDIKSIDASSEILRHMESLTEKDVTFFDNIESIPERHSFHNDGYIAILCVEGKASCTVAGRTFEIRKNDLFLSEPDNFVENTLTSFDFKARGVFMSPAYFESLFMLSSSLWNVKMVLQDSPLLHLSDDDVRQFSLDMEFLLEKLRRPHTPHRDELMRHLLIGLLYDFLDCLQPKLAQVSYNYTSSEKIFLQFMSLVKANTPLHRDVKFYADRLCITSKYLSAVCKQNAGKTASEIINSATVEQIKQQLLSTDRSVKEIAFGAGFDNVSFFGKYVRRELGMSPRKFRMTK